MVILIRSYGFLARLIHFGMWIFNIKTKRPTLPTYNHAEIWISDIVSGAIGKGISNRSFKNAFINDGKERDILLYDVCLTEQEAKELKAYTLDKEGTKYEISNFLNHARRILFGTWTGHTKEFSDKKLYCIEYVAKGLNHVFPELIDKPWEINPVEFKEFMDANFGKPIKLHLPVKVNVES